MSKETDLLKDRIEELESLLKDSYEMNNLLHEGMVNLENGLNRFKEMYANLWHDHRELKNENEKLSEYLDDCALYNQSF